ncbi:hypothetical protein [Magnetospirillum sp. UT-4]|uniref:hypothetical protein n=1 Tax=Magnetospirillum sp. UT-4 TaxID=2681467 RepID=UPI0015724DD5|nr:hypothetical protein [Magnetospirillum sp. UT-4]
MRRWSIVFLALTVSACASPLPKPLIDLKAVDDPQQYQKDLIECVTLADYHLTSELQQTYDGMMAAAKSGVGSGIGAVALGSSSGSVGGDVVTGAIGGFIAGQLHAAREQERYRNMGTARCLQNRGYEVANAKQLMIDPRGWCATLCVATDECWWNTKRVDECVPGEEARLERLRSERRRAKSNPPPAS